MKKKTRKSPVCALCSTLGTMLLILVIIVCIPFTLPKILGYQAYTVISGSMEPEIPVGALVYVGQIEPKEVEKEDVIAFYGGRDSSAIITHRVVENRVVMGEFITKGDANQTNDMQPVKYGQFIGKVEMTMPKLGIIAQMLTGYEGKIAAGCAIGLAIILHVIASILDPNTSKKKNPRP